ncbi:hypothetical protein RHMOL_Rhmol02G0224700 [Rhododendron molle]|uniref:Uncharacterized protein n=1 Tax=Rhododendron molle TaxID=49168 RepID=A0ACC0PUK8_RHOML|nr:hypothetical protein RHMOL_Rhmol02G0224700 [Rhododendron molle]
MLATPLNPALYQAKNEIAAEQIVYKEASRGDLGQWPPQHPIAPPIVLSPTPVSKPAHMAPEVPILVPEVLEEEEDPEELLFDATETDHWDAHSVGSEESVIGPCHGASGGG